MINENVPYLVVVVVRSMPGVFARLFFRVLSVNIAIQRQQAYHLLQFSTSADVLMHIHTHMVNGYYSFH